MCGEVFPRIREAHDNKKELFSRKGNKYFLNVQLFPLKNTGVGILGIAGDNMNMTK